MDLTTATDNEIIAALQLRNLVPTIIKDATDDEIIDAVIDRGINMHEIYDAEDDREPDHGPEDQFLDGQMEMEDRFAFDNSPEDMDD